MGLLGIVQNDIKRVVAYSTLSQLGYMTVALGASAYSAAIFHLMTHAFFKALLFLAAGSVIIAMHHEQDIRKMGGIRKYMPITYWTALIGSLRIDRFPGYVGLLLEGPSDRGRQGIALARAGRRLLDRVPERVARRIRYGAVFVPHVLPRVPWRRAHGCRDEVASARDTGGRNGAADTVGHSVGVIGWFTVGPVLFGDYFGDAIYVSRRTTCSAHMGEHLAWQPGACDACVMTPVFWLAAAGVFSAWFLYLKRPDIPATIQDKLSGLYNLLDRKYYFDDL